MYLGNCILENVAFNKYTTMPDYGIKIIEHIMMNNEVIWKLLKYDTQDALSLPNLTTEEKRNLIWGGTDDSESYKVFRVPFLDDAFTKQTSQLRIYVSSGIPNNRSVGTVDISIEVITHLKLVNLNNYQSRAERLLAEVIKTLNGQDINGVGKLFFDAKESMYNNFRANIFNNRNFFGYTLVMSVKTGDM